MLKVGDYVTRKKYGNDILFKVDKIVNNTVYLKGVEIRLYADSSKEDLILSSFSKKKDDFDKIRELNIKDFFYIPGTILHLDSDQEYIDKCNEYYKTQQIKVFSYRYKESEFKDNVISLIKKHNPKVLVITGHDAYYNKDGDYTNMSNYKNSDNFIQAVKVARSYEKDHDKLIVIAGACQSNYEELIKAGSNFASSPKRINIHALDPAIIAVSVSLSSKNKDIDLIKILGKTKYGTDGMGGIITNGTMYIGYPR